MKKIVLLAAVAAMAIHTGAQNSAQPVGSTQNRAALFDSTQVERLQEVVVHGVRGTQSSRNNTSTVYKHQLNEFSTTGKELPLLFSQYVGVLSWSENGLGTGTTYMRIRGAGDSRINVTLDGVPLNSPEDQAVFWANMNSYSALLGGVQIQRGVGTSTNGDGAFGGTVVLSSKMPSEKAGGEVNFSYGSYNTFNVGGSFSTDWEREPVICASVVPVTHVSM